MKIDLIKGIIIYTIKEKNYKINYIMLQTNTEKITTILEKDGL